MPRKRKLEDRLTSDLADLTNLLRLADWKISLSIIESGKVAESFSGRYGRTDMSQFDMTAEITLVRHSDYRVMRATLAHELLHIPLAPVTPDSDTDSLAHLLEERAINQIAEALIRLLERAEGEKEN